MSKDAKDKNDSSASEPMKPSRLRLKFQDEVSKKTGEKFGLENPMSRPTMEKIVINVNMGRHLDGAKLPANVRDTVLDRVLSSAGVRAIRDDVEQKVRDGELTPALAAQQILDAVDWPAKADG